MFDKSVTFEFLKSQFENNHHFDALLIIRGDVFSKFCIDQNPGRPIVGTPVAQLKRWADHIYSIPSNGEHFVYHCKYSDEERGQQILDSLNKLTQYYPFSRVLLVQSHDYCDPSSVFYICMDGIEDRSTDIGIFRLNHLVKFKLVFHGTDRLFDLEPEYFRTLN